MRFTAYLDLTGWFPAGIHRSHSMSWESVTGERLTLDVRRAPQGFPGQGNLEAARRYCRDQLRQIRGAIISCDFTAIGNLEGLKIVSKMPAGTGRAMRFTAEVLVRFGDRLARLGICAEESGITGVREAEVLSELARSASPAQLQHLSRGEMPPEWKFERYEPSTGGEFAYVLSDDEKYDQRFASHPLTIVRRRMKWLEKSFGITVSTEQGSHAGTQTAEGKRSGGLFSKLTRTLARDPRSPLLDLREEPDQLTIEKSTTVAPSLETVEQELGKDIAEDLRRPTDVPLSLRQQEIRERVNRQNAEAAAKTGSTKVRPSTNAKAFCAVAGQSFPGLREAIERVPATLPDLLLETSEAIERCWLLETRPAKQRVILNLAGGATALPVFSSQALAENFTQRTRLRLRAVGLSAEHFRSKLREPGPAPFSLVAANPCPECLEFGVITTTAASSLSSAASVLTFLVLNRAIVQTKARWALQSALEESEVKKRMEKLSLAVRHFDPGHPAIHLELIRTGKTVNEMGTIALSSSRIHQYSPSYLCDLAALLYQPAEQQPAEMLALQRNCALDMVWVTAEATDNFDAAAKFFSDCLFHKPDDPVAHRHLAGALWYGGELDKAVDIYSRALLLCPADSALLSARGQIFAELGEYEKALADLESSLQCIGAAPLLKEEPKVQSRAYALSGRGAAYAGLANFDLAQRDFDESVALCPKNAWVYYNMALAHESKGELDSAFRNYVISLKMHEPKLNPRRKTAALARLAILKPHAGGIDFV